LLACILNSLFPASDLFHQIHPVKHAEQKRIAGDAFNPKVLFMDGIKITGKIPPVENVNLCGASEQRAGYSGAQGVADDIIAQQPF
jgi:hypothetical protein